MLYVTASLLVFRLVELDGEITGRVEEGHEPIAAVFDRLRELNSALLQLGHGLLDVVAIKGDVRRPGVRPAGAFRGMHSQVRLGRIEDEPASAQICSFKAKLVFEESSQLIG